MAANLWPRLEDFIFTANIEPLNFFKYKTSRPMSRHNAKWPTLSRMRMCVFIPKISIIQVDDLLFVGKSQI